MQSIDNSNKSIWWDLAYSWLYEENPGFADALLSIGILEAYLDNCAENASFVMGQYTHGRMEEDEAASQLLAAMIPQDARIAECQSPSCLGGDFSTHSMGTMGMACGA